MSSPITWTLRNSPNNNLWNGVTYGTPNGSGLFVSVAGSGFGSGIGNRVMTSPDGITWTSRTSAANNSWNSVTYGNNLFVAVSSTGIGNRVMTSPDGITWTSRTSAADNSWNSVTCGNNLFVAVAASGIGNRSMTSPDGITWTLNTSAANNIWRSVTYGNNLFVAVASLGTGNRVMTGVQPPIPCFKEGSKILTDQGYKLIQDLRKGHLVKTLNHGFKPIDLIGKKEIYHPASKERIKDQLYQCSQDYFEEVFEPLIITGCHSFLVDSFVSEEQREKVIVVNGNTYVTDRKYRLPACADPRASIYEIPGNYTIYHLALENDDYYMNYGIYANGLLVETCSKRYLKELSNMKFI